MHVPGEYQVARVTFSAQAGWRWGEIAKQLQQLTASIPRWNFGKIFHCLRNQGYLWKNKRAGRVCRE